ncbi:hypothetical protein F5B21DRAFT_481447 [Xylaria acuta]|nr:hypothetical protein F5B21DRAFT_481447 [Xylaria acuta]
MRLAAPIYALSLLGVAIADCGVEGGTIVVANPNYQILDELETCSTIFGDILVDPAFVYFILDGPLEITGTVIAHDNSILKFVSLSNVTHLGGFSFASPQITGRINFPEVTKIDHLEWRNITWKYDDDYLEWGAEKLVAVSSINVEATDLSGFFPDYESYDGSFYYGGLEQLATADNIRVVDNRRMDNVVFSGLKIISGSLIVGNNVNFYRPAGKRDTDSRLISFPALESAGSVVIYDDEPYSVPQEGKIDFPALGHVFGDFNVTNTERITEISVPALTDIDGGLYILNGKGLNNLDFPELRRVNHVVLDGGDSYYGGFEKIAFPVLEEVGAFHVNSPAYVFDCSSLDHIREIASEFSCSNPEGTYNPDTPSSTTEVPTPSPSSSGSSPTTTTDEPSITSEPIPTDQPSLTNGHATTGSPEPTSNPDATEGAGATPTSENPADASESTPATSGASSLRSPFSIISMLLKHWVL